MGKSVFLLFDGLFLFGGVSWFGFFGPLCGATVYVCMCEEEKNKRKNSSNDMAVITQCWAASCDAMRTNPFLQLSRSRRSLLLLGMYRCHAVRRTSTLYALWFQKICLHAKCGYTPIKRMILFSTEIKKITSTTTTWNPHANRHTLYSFISHTTHTYLNTRIKRTNRMKKKMKRETKFT